MPITGNAIRCFDVWRKLEPGYFSLNKVFLGENYKLGIVLKFMEERENRMLVGKKMNE